MQKHVNGQMQSWMDKGFDFMVGREGIEPSTY
jgi:hypothetical protein